MALNFFFFFARNFNSDLFSPLFCFLSIGASSFKCVVFTGPNEQNISDFDDGYLLYSLFSFQRLEIELVYKKARRETQRTARKKKKKKKELKAKRLRSIRCFSDGLIYPERREGGGEKYSLISPPCIFLRRQPDQKKEKKKRKPPIGCSKRKKKKRPTIERKGGGCAGPEKNWEKMTVL